MTFISELKFNSLVFESFTRSYSIVGGIRDTVVALWTAGHKVERSILRQGHDSKQYSSIRQGCLRPSIIALQCCVVA